jgi:ATP-dependent Clp protease, protease subunit
MEQVLGRHTGRDVATLRADTDRDKIFTAEQAVAYGLADHIISTRVLAGQSAG